MAPDLGGFGQSEVPEGVSIHLFVERLPAQCAVRGMSDHDVRALMRPYRGEVGGRRLIRMSQSLDARYTQEVADDLRHLRLPRAVIWGAADPFQPLESVGRPLAEALGVDPVVVEAGHFAMEDAPDEVAQAILAVARAAFGEGDDGPPGRTGPLTPGTPPPPPPPAPGPPTGGAPRPPRGRA